MSFQAKIKGHKIVKIPPYLEDTRSYCWWKVRRKNVREGKYRFGFLKPFTKKEKKVPRIRW